jgi:hypothetical protein
VSTLYAIRLTNDPGHINSENADSTTVTLWGPDYDRVKDGISTYEQKGYRVLEEWEAPDTAASHASFVGAGSIRV